MLTSVLRRVRPTLAGLLALGMLLSPGAAVPVAAQDGHAGLHGVVYQADASGRYVGAKVIAINVKTRKEYVSNVTDDNGAYEIDGLPGGTYDIAIDTGEGLYLADNLVDLSEHQDLSVSYSVQPMRPANRKLAGMQSPKGSATPVGAFRGTGDAAGELSGGGRSFWKSPGGIVLLSVLVVGAALAVKNHNDSNASPSAP